MAYALPFLLAFLVLAYLLRIDFLITVLWFVAALLLLSRLWAARLGRGLTVERVFPERAFIGDDLPAALTLQNASVVPMPWIELSESVPLDLRGAPFPTQVFSLGPHGTRTFTYTLTCRKRGYYRLGPASIATGDLLGVRVKRLAAPERRSITVYPRIVPLQRLGLPTASALVSLATPVPLFEDTSRVMGVRDYVPGDSPRRIHWTASARTGDLVVKQYQPAIARETMICLDLDIRDYDTYRSYEAKELAIVTAASVANHTVVREGLPAGLSAVGLDAESGEVETVVLPPGRERGHLMGILEVLARLDDVPSGTFSEMVRREGMALRWGSTVLVITGSVSPDLAETVFYLKRQGRAVGVIVVTPSAAEAAIPGVAVHRVAADTDLGVLT